MQIRQLKSHIRRFSFVAAVHLSILLMSGTQMARGQVSLPMKWANSQVFSPQSVAFSNDGKWVAVGGWGGAILYNRSSGASTNLEPLGGIVNNVSFSPNSRTLALTTENSMDVCVTQIWNVPNLKLTATIPYPATSTGCIAFSPVDSQLAIAGASASGIDCVQIFDTISLKPIETLDLDFRPVSVAFSASGRLLACGGRTADANRVKVWDRKTGTLLNSFSTSSQSDMQCLALSPDGKSVASCGGYLNGGSLSLWNVETGMQVQSIPVGSCYAVLYAAYSPDGKSLACSKNLVDGDSNVELWDIATAKQKGTIHSLDTLVAQGLAFSKDGTIWASVGSETGLGAYLEFWTATGAPKGVVITDATTVTGPVSFSSNGKILSVPGTLMSLSGTSPVIDQYDAETGKLLNPAHIPTTGTVTASAVSPTQNAVAFASVVESAGPTQSTVLELRSSITGSILQSFDSSNLASINSLAFSPDGTRLYIATGSSSYKAYVVHVANGGAPQPLAGLPPVLGVDLPTSASQVSFRCTNGASLSTSIVNSLTESVEATISSDLGRVMGEAVSPDGRTLAVEGCDIYSEGSGQSWQEYAYGYIELWDIASGTLIAKLGGDSVGVPLPGMTNAIAFTPDGQYLFGVYQGPVAVSMVDHSIQSLDIGSETSMAFSPDGSLLASGPWGEEGVCVASNPFFGLVVPNALTLNPSLVTGGSTVMATLHLTKPAPAKGAILTLTSGDPHAAVPASVVVLPGQLNVSFQIQTTKVSAKTAAKISAAAGSLSTSATLVIS